MDYLKVSSKSSPASVAGAIAGMVKDGVPVNLQCVGAGAVNQAIKAMAIARGFLIPTGFDISCGDEIWSKLSGCGVKYSAAVIYGDWATLGFLRNATASGIRIPEELSLISYCNIPLRLGNLQVTRVAARHSELGKAVGKLLLNQQESGGNAVMVAPRMMEGNTVMQSLQPREC